MHVKVKCPAENMHIQLLVKNTYSGELSVIGTVFEFPPCTSLLDINKKYQH